MKILKWVIFKEKNHDKFFEKCVQEEVNYRIHIINLNLLFNNFLLLMLGGLFYFLLKR